MGGLARFTLPELGSLAAWLQIVDARLSAHLHPILANLQTMAQSWLSF